MKLSIHRHLILAATALFLGGTLAYSATPEPEMVEMPPVKTKAVRKKKIVKKSTVAPKGSMAVTDAKPKKATSSKAFQAWLREMKKRISRSQVRNNQLVAVAAVRGDEQPDSPPLYWKGKASQGPVANPELKEFETAIDSAMAGDSGAKEKLMAFAEAHPESALLPDVQETLNRMEQPAP